MSDINATLAASLRLAKTTPMFFAFIVKGTNDGVLLVDKKKIPPQAINEAKQSSGGKQVIQGRCQGEEGKLVCDVAKEPPGTLAKQIKTVIHRNAGMTLDVTFRVVTDLGEEQGEQETQTPEGQEKKTTGTTPPPLAPPKQPPLPGPTAAERFAARLKALAPVMQKLEATGSEAAKAVKQHIAEANKLYVGKNYDQANAALDLAETMLKQALQPPTPPSPPPSPDKATYEKRMQALGPILEKALQQGLGDTGQLRALRAFTQEKAEAGNYHTALQSLDKLEALLKEMAKLRQPERGGSKLVKQRQFMLTRSARIPPELKGELSRLRKAMVEEAADSNPQELGDALETYVLDLLAAIQDDLDDAVNAGDTSVFNGLRATVEEDGVLTHLTSAPGIDGAKFKDAILTAMGEIETAMTA